MVDSEYGYIGETDLESFMGITFASIDVTFTDAVTAAIISIAERIVNSYIGTSQTTTTDAVIACTTIIAADLMQNLMFSHGYTTDKDMYKELKAELIEKLLAGDSDVGVDSIPMSGAEISRPSRYIRYI